MTRTINRPLELIWSVAVRSRVLVAAAALALMGCSLDGLLKSDELPKDVTNPALIKTREGALAAYRGVIVQFRRAFAGHPFFNAEAVAGVVPLSGAFTDELQALGGGSPADKRSFAPEGTDGVASTGYSELQRVRGQASQDLGLLRDYAPDQQALAGHVYALQGYAEVFLAELFCSGIPLSTLDYNGDFTLSSGSTTAQVLAHAVALFDTALTVGSDSARIMDFARIGKARALLGLGDYAQAAATVAAVADDYVYGAHYGPDYTLGAADDQRNFAWVELGASTPWAFSVADREGTRGLDYVSSGDPRTAVRDVSGLRHPMKYAVDGSSPIVVASGVEARLIEAEAALQADDPAWLVKLNTLRTDGTQDGSGNYNPGTGGVAGLAPLDDPGAAISDPAAAKAVRVDLLFRERAFWLFLTGHRQGDLRRLIRQYGRSHDQVYPIGAYPPGGFYGSDVTAPIPQEERMSNPKFTGCASRGA